MKDDPSKLKKTVQAPQSEKETPTQPYDQVKLLGRIDTLESGQKLLNDTVKFVKDANYVVLIVLALGFIALLLSLISIIIQASNSTSSVQIEFIKSIEQLKHEVNDLNSLIGDRESTSSNVVK